MARKSSLRTIAVVVGTLLGFLVIELNPEALFVPEAPLLFVSLSSDAEARIGRPVTPLSYAGVARRTTRRVVRRSAIYVNTLPAGCGQVTIDAAMYWQCGATYYQPAGVQYVVVYVE